MVDKAYKVLKVAPMSRVADEGGIEKYYRIQYKSGGGVVDTLDVSAENYTEDKLPPLLREAAQRHDKILKL